MALRIAPELDDENEGYIARDLAPPGRVDVSNRPF